MKFQWYYFFPGFLHFKCNFKENTSWAPLLFPILERVKKRRRPCIWVLTIYRGRQNYNKWPTYTELSLWKHSVKGTEKKKTFYSLFGRVVDALEEVLSWDICKTLIWKYSGETEYLGLGLCKTSGLKTLFLKNIIVIHP